MGSNSYLPEDIIRGILLRLPVRSLLRFMAISKHWFALITSSDFLSNHYQLPSNPKLCIMLTWRDPFSISVFRDGPERVDDRNMPLEKDLDEHGARIVGSSNGLLCLSTRWRNTACYVLWNPATRQHRKLPPYKEIGYSHDEGFGFHQGINDYKLLQLFSNSKNQREAVVFALSTDSWRKVKDAVPSYDHSISKPVVVKGVWYNLAVYQERPYIMRFDMSDDSFSKVEAAPLQYNDYVVADDIDVHLYKVELMVYKELPAICTYDYDSSTKINISAFQFDLWVMKNESWTMVLTCSRNSFRVVDICLPPFGFWVDEESIVLDLERIDTLCLFNLSTKQSKMLVLGKALVSGRAHNYVESMVSVYTNN